MEDFGFSDSQDCVPSFLRSLRIVYPFIANCESTTPSPITKKNVYIKQVLNGILKFFSDKILIWKPVKNICTP